MRRLVIFIKYKLQDSRGTGPLSRVAVIGPVALLEIALRPECNHLRALFQVINVAHLLFPEVLLQVLLLASEHRFAQ